MGRVRTKTVKKSSRQVIERYYSKMTLDFHTNKKILEEVAIIPSKRLRNKIAGFSTHLMKRIQKGPVRGISLKLQEEERERRMDFVPDESAIKTDHIEVDKETIELLASLGMSELPGVVLKEEIPVVSTAISGAYGGGRGGGGRSIQYDFEHFGYPFCYPNGYPKFRISENRISEFSDTDSDTNINYPKISDIRNSDIRIFGYPTLNTPIVDSRLHAQWKSTRGLLSKHWKENEGKTNPQLARSKISPICRTKDDWKHLCDYWELEKTRKYSDKMEANRGKQVHVSRGGSCSIANLVFKMDDMVKHKEAAIAKLNSEGTTITTAIEIGLEKEAINFFCGREKTLQSAWEVGVGPVLRKKDKWMKAVVESSQRDSSEAEELRNKVTKLEEQLKENKKRSERMIEFMSNKFPDFENTILTSVGNEDDAYHGILSDSENMI